MDVKQDVKRLVSSVLAYKNMCALYETAFVADVVSFDIFDTLIKRDVLLPTDVFELVSMTYCERTGRVLNGYRTQRVRAEKNARLISAREEVTLTEIYAFLFDYDVNTCNQLMRLEIELEERICEPNEVIVELFYDLISAGRQVIITSDMYLPEWLIVRILRKCGCNGYEHLYLSSSYMKTKHSGNLFATLRKDYPTASILHIGDNPFADWVMAERAGLKAALI